MTKDSLDWFLAGSHHKDAPTPDFDAIIGYRPRRRRLRRTPLALATLVIVAGAIVLALPDMAPQMPPDLAGTTSEFAVFYTTDWLAEPPGFEWISSVPKLTIDTGEYHADL